MSESPPKSPTSPQTSTSPTYQLEFTSDDTEERLASLKQRLAAISSKHAQKRASAPPDLSRSASAIEVITEIANLEEQRRRSNKNSASGKGGDGIQKAREPGEPERKEAVDGGVWRKHSAASTGSQTKNAATSPIVEAVAPAIPVPSIIIDAPLPSETCICNAVVNPEDPQFCLSCSGILMPIAQINRSRQELTEQLAQARHRLQVAEERQDESTKEMARLRLQVQDLEEELARVNAEMAAAKVDMDVLNQKLIDEIEIRGELQASKEAVQDELEELTKTLFEEANSLVAAEARRRHQHEKKEKSLEVLLGETTSRLQMEQEQLRELRIKMAELQMAHERWAAGEDDGAEEEETDGTAAGTGEAPDSHPVVVNAPPGSQPSSSGPAVDETIDQLLFAEFEEFLNKAATLKPSKINTLQFMRNTLDDDITPCLRFGGNPRTSTKKLIDAIQANTCYVEEMTQAQMAAFQAKQDRMQSSVERPLSPRPPNSSQSTDERRSSLSTPSDSPTPVRPGPPPSSMPTQTIFNKTVMERLTSFGSSFSAGSLTLPTASSSSTSSSTSSSSTYLLNGCSTCGRSGMCRFQFKTTDLPDDIWCPICTNCRDRLVSVCEFYNFIRHVRQGLYTSRKREDLWKEMVGFKRKMFLARVGLAKAEGGVPLGSRGARRSHTRPNSMTLTIGRSPSGSSEIVTGEGRATPEPAAGAGQRTSADTERSSTPLEAIDTARRASAASGVSSPGSPLPPSWRSTDTMVVNGVVVSRSQAS
ncbi:hypothetical protein HK104_009922 [Borealophlyctis nickersoniae]|nr:hypothetical protein HK104_009922 [Borealophlyctis nickersoniae]